MTESKAKLPSKAKPHPKFLTYAQAMSEYRVIHKGMRALGTLLLSSDVLSSEDRATLLALQAILKGRIDGS